MRIHGETLVHRPAADVFDFVADERNNYDQTISKTELLSARPIGAGTRFRSISRTRSRNVEMIIEIVDYDRPHRLTTASRTPGMEIISTLTFHPERGATRIRWGSDLRPQGALRLLTPLLAAYGRRRARAIWHGLRRTLETPPAATARTPAP